MFTNISVIVISVILWIGIASSCALMASNKGKDAVTWFIIGLFLGIVAIVILAVMPAENHKPSASDAIDTISRLDVLRRSGAITEEEFNEQKKRLLE